MAGGIIPPDVAAAISNAGCLGSIAAGGLSITELESQIGTVHALTRSPFQVNLFANDYPEPYAIAAINKELNTIRQRLGIPVIESYSFTTAEPLESYVDLCIQYKVPVVSFTFGCPTPSLVDKLHDAGVTIMGTISTVGEALRMRNLGIDIVIAQGYEAGGHKGGFTDSPSIGLMALVPQVVDAIDLPVVAAGGISDRRGVQAAILLGADYIQAGTRFLNTFESTAHPLHKAAISRAYETDALYTSAFSGKTARGIRNQMMDKLSHLEIPPYPYMNIMTKDIRAAAKNQQQVDFMSNWSGQNIRSSETQSISCVIAELTASFR